MASLYFLLFILFTLNEPIFSQNETHVQTLTCPENVEDFVFKGKIPNHKNTNPKLSIANGLQARNEQFPYVVELSINTNTGGFLCTGSLIGVDWILTARHCAADKSVIQVRASLGSADRTSTSRVNIIVDRMFWIISSDGNHPDIALFHLQRSAPINNFISIIRLPSLSREHFGYEGNDFSAIGWGQVSAGVLSRYLQFTRFKVLPRVRCNLGKYLLCSQPPVGTSSLLGGDSGGPAVITEADGTETLIGVNVAIVKTMTTVWQATTRVTSFLRWIQQQSGIAYNY